MNSYTGEEATGYLILRKSSCCCEKLATKMGNLLAFAVFCKEKSFFEGKNVSSHARRVLMFTIGTYNRVFLFIKSEYTINEKVGRGSIQKAPETKTAKVRRQRL